MIHFQQWKKIGIFPKVCILAVGPTGLLFSEQWELFPWV